MLGVGISRVHIGEEPGAEWSSTIDIFLYFYSRLTESKNLKNGGLLERTITELKIIFVAHAKTKQYSPVKTKYRVQITKLRI